MCVHACVRGTKCCHLTPHAWGLSQVATIYALYVILFRFLHILQYTLSKQSSVNIHTCQLISLLLLPFLAALLFEGLTSWILLSCWRSCTLTCVSEGLLWLSACFSVNEVVTLSARTIHNQVLFWAFVGTKYMNSFYSNIGSRSLYWLFEGRHGYNLVRAQTN